MKLTRTFIGFSSAMLALIAGIVTVHYVAHAMENGPAVHVDSTPISRDARLGTSYAPVVKKVAASVVNIYSTRFVREQLNPFFEQFYQGSGEGRELTRRDNWLGSGIVVTPDGYILTANHVVEGADEVKVSLPNDKTEYSAKIIGTDPPTDVAILKIEAKDLPAITLGDSDQLEVGDIALAIGNPFGLGQTVTMGIISALGRSIEDPNDFNPYHGARYQNFIQTDAAINEGNSGGALVDAEGRLIGINDAIISPNGGNLGIGFAVPINMARSVMEGIISGGKVTRGYLGIDPQDIDAGLAKGFGVPTQGGALVADVGPGSPAAKAGIVSGDAIVAINDKEITGADNLRVTVSQLRPGSQARLKIYRNGIAKVIVVTLGERADTVLNSSKPNDSSGEIPKADALAGVYVRDLDSIFRHRLRAPASVMGALVMTVDRSSNSYEAGLRQGDVIVEVNHQPVASAEDTVRLCRSAKSDGIVVKIWRPLGGGGTTRYLSVDNTKLDK